MRVRPVTPEALVRHVTEEIARRPGHPWLRVAIDGAPAARPDVLADALAGELRVLGRAPLRVRAGDFLRPASLRLEHGRHDADAFYWGWLDEKALVREVLAPLDVGGTGRVLPSLRDAERDRATRAPYTELPPGGVLLLDGPLLLGQGLPLDLTVHLHMSPAALARRTPPDEQWTLPAYARYDEEAQPEVYADVAARCDDPRHPALLDRP